MLLSLEREWMNVKVYVVQQIRKQEKKKKAVQATWSPHFEFSHSTRPSYPISESENENKISFNSSVNHRIIFDDEIFHKKALAVRCFVALGNLVISATRRRTNKNRKYKQPKRASQHEREFKYYWTYKMKTLEKPVAKVIKSSTFWIIINFPFFRQTKKKRLEFSFRTLDFFPITLQRGRGKKL